jgi:DNA-binding MarR family transcriptional regulator/GNAT superfamily N-acetyltransferase
MKGSRIPRVRSFNRLVSQTVGALQDRYLGLDRPLAEARLIFEIGKDGAEVKNLRMRLGLDSGYLSRLLRSLERQGLVTTPVTSRDKRIRRTILTSGGLAELRELDRRSDGFAQSLLDPLTEAQQTSLIEAMGEVERLLSVSAVTLEEESAMSADAQFCLGEYFRELSVRFKGGFDPGKSLSPSAEEFAPPQGLFLVMRLNGEPVGCGALKRLPSNAAYLKRMWIAHKTRGLGLGRRLLQELENRARLMGYRTALLETNKSLVEAQRLYRSVGYREVAPFNDEPYAHHWFKKSLTKS